MALCYSIEKLYIEGLTRNSWWRVLIRGMWFWKLAILFIWPFAFSFQFVYWFVWISLLKWVIAEALGSHPADVGLCLHAKILLSLHLGWSNDVEICFYWLLLRMDVFFVAFVFPLNYTRSVLQEGGSNLGYQGSTVLTLEKWGASATELLVFWLRRLDLASLVCCFIWVTIVKME